MIHIIEHRKNKISDLSLVLPKYGVEIDLRSNINIQGSIHLSHDVWSKGDDFEQWLAEFKKRNIQGTLILNTKEDGLEEQIIFLLKKYDVNNFLFLDTIMPTLVKWVKKGLGKYFFLRVSYYEDFQTVLSFKNHIEWVWLDCFDAIPVSTELAQKISQYFKICLVAPELQGGIAEDNLKFSSIIPFAQAVCTKKPELWKLCEK